jgi:hypothetical protein
MAMDSTFLENIQKLEEIGTHEEKLYYILEIYMKLSLLKIPPYSDIPI